MVKETIDGIFRQTNLTNESAEYLAKREEVRLAEIELMRARERVAELRRALPNGAEIQDYEFLEGPASLGYGDEPVTKVRLSELFSSPSPAGRGIKGEGLRDGSYAPHPNPLPAGEGEKLPERSLVIYHFMFGKKQSVACPMCTAWIDGYNGVAHHLAQTTDFAIVAAADPAALRAYARERGWNKLRLLSTGDNTFKYDLGSENKEGNQDSQISVFTKDADGTLRHFYSGHPWLDPEIKERGIDELTPIWNILDLTPQGRGKFYTSLDYGTKVQIAST
jgi:predicted dithiol-disulfide oxidoreductase (DUF899 family)